MTARGTAQETMSDLNLEKTVMLTDKEVARELGCGTTSVWSWVKLIPNFPRPYKVGPKATRFMKDEVEAYRESRRQS
jgi:predicted DNA-binding transcriptional regulator AlpA